MYKKKLVRKCNSLVTARFYLTLGEQRLLLLAATKMGSASEDPIKGMTITVHEYAKAYKVAPQGVYRTMLDASAKLKERWVYIYEDDKYTESRWVAHLTYTKGCDRIVFGFAPKVIPFFVDLKECFTSYELEQIVGLSSAYSLRLYELLIQWRTVGKTPVFELSDLRQLLGIEDHEYPRMDHFKLRVLDLAVKQISETTDIEATYEQHKQGRSITGVSFSFKPSPRAKKEAIAAATPKGLTPKQCKYFAAILCRQSSMAEFSRSGDSFEEYAKWLEVELGKPERVEQWMAQLIEAGYKRNHMRKK